MLVVADQLFTIRPRLTEKELQPHKPDMSPPDWPANATFNCEMNTAEMTPIKVGGRDWSVVDYGMIDCAPDADFGLQLTVPPAEYVSMRRFPEIDYIIGHSGEVSSVTVKYGSGSTVIDQRVVNVLRARRYVMARACRLCRVNLTVPIKLLLRPQE
jgi:hypothetical protein